MKMNSIGHIMENPEIRVKEICKAKGLSLKQLAEKIGIGPETLTRAISDNANPTLNTLQKIAKALDMEVGELLVNSKTTNHICGHIEVDGEIYSIKNISDLESLYKKLKESSK